MPMGAQSMIKIDLNDLHIISLRCGSVCIFHISKWQTAMHLSRT